MNKKNKRPKLVATFFIILIVTLLTFGIWYSFYPLYLKYTHHQKIVIDSEDYIVLAAYLLVIYLIIQESKKVLKFLFKNSK